MWHAKSTPTVSYFSFVRESREGKVIQTSVNIVKLMKPDEVHNFKLRSTSKTTNERNNSSNVNIHNMFSLNCFLHKLMFLLFKYSLAFGLILANFQTS